MPRYILALDQGTTSSRAIVFDHGGRIIASAQQEFPQILPAPGVVEHDPEAIWSSQLETARAAMAHVAISAADVAAIGVTNQRETTILWDRQTGRAVAPAIVWQSRISAGICERLKAEGLEETFRAKTGLVVDAYFSGTKITHLLDTIDGLRGRAERGKVLFGTVDSWLLWRLTGGRVHATDYSNASRTLLYNIHKLDWDDELLGILGVPRAMLPEVRSSSEVYGTTAEELLGGAIPIAGVAGDQQAATFGQACFSPGTAKNTYGTGCFLLMNTGGAPIESRHRMLTTIGWGLGGKITYCLEGSIFIGGAVVQWLRDGLGLIESSADVEELAAQAADTDGVYFVPAFVGHGRAVLGPVRPRHDHWADAGHDGGPSRACRAGIDGLPNPRRAGGDAKRRRHRLGRVEGRRRGVGQRFADAVPGGHSGRARLPAGRGRDDRPGRGLFGGAGGELLARSGRVKAELGRAAGVPAEDAGGPAQRAVRPLAKGRGTVARLGRVIQGRGTTKYAKDTKREFSHG